MKFRPCIDIHNGQVKQIVGGSLTDVQDQASENFVSEQDASFYAELYKKAGIKGGHVILLNGHDSPYYESTKEQAILALHTYPGGLQIGGVVEGEKQYVKKVYLLTNIDESNEHFSMDPKEQLAAVKDMRKNGYVPLGNFHSHPESPSRPSEEDKRLAYDSKANYLILSLMEADNPVLNAFRVDEEKQVTKEELVIS